MLEMGYEFDHEHTKTVRSLAVSKHGGMIAMGSFDATISLWDKYGAEYRCITILEGHENEVKAVCFHPEHNYLASCSRDKSVWIWDFDEELEFECLETLMGHEEDVKMVKFVPGDAGVSSKSLVSVSYDNSVKLWSVDETGEYYCQQTIQEHTNIVWSVCFSKTGALMFTCSSDCTVKAFQRNKDGSYSLSINLSGYHSLPIYSVDYSDEFGVLLMCGEDETITLVKITEKDGCLDGTLIHRLVGPGSCLGVCTLH